MFVKPAHDCAVRDPASMALLPAEGREVPDDLSHGGFWHRAIADGSVVLSKPPAAAEETAQEPAAHEGGRQ